MLKSSCEWLQSKVAHAEIAKHTVFVYVHMHVEMKVQVGILYVFLELPCVFHIQNMTFKDMHVFGQSDNGDIAQN